MNLDRHFDLAALARGNTRRDHVKIRPVPVRLSFEEGLQRIILRSLRELSARRADIVSAAGRDRSGLTHDAFGLSSVLDAVRSTFRAAADTARGAIDTLFKGEARRHDAAWIRQVKVATGVDLTMVIRPGDTASAIALAVQENVARIKGLGEDVARRVEVASIHVVRTRGPMRAVDQAISDALAFATGHANLIAVDQATSFNALLNQARQEQAGIDSYVWSTLGDARVRPAHSARDGQTFRWDAPPRDGHPGEPARCRCVPLGLLDLRKKNVGESSRARARRAGTSAVAAALGLSL